MSVRSRLAALTTLLLLVALGAAAETVPVGKATDYVGKDVTIEGRVVATYESPLATVLAFGPNFAGFTASILAGDRPKFPSDLDARYRGRLVQVTGTINAYRGKPEMTIHEPSQLALVVDPNASPSPAAGPSVVPLVVIPPSTDLAQIRESLAAIEERLGALEGRFTTVEQALATQADQARAAAATRPTPVANVRGLGIGASPADVRAALGRPEDVRNGLNGAEVWMYGTGRTVTFDDTGRVVAWTGF